MGKSHAPTEPSHMGIHGDAGNPKGIAQYHIGGFSTYPCQWDKLLDRFRDEAPMNRDQFLATGDNVCRFVSKKTGGLDQRL